ncbi:MAG TPA: molybdenum cofactor guanylyltransferase [Bacteroidales bacterium]|nr:molybdenum cofactor guanylyltransferase [Bacteroidales bacterium]
MYENFSGIILAGGENKRFDGIIKSLSYIDGKQIVKRIILVLEQLFPEIIIVTNLPGEFREFSRFKIVSDKIIGKGPLGGIHAGLEAAANELCFVIAGDMPFPDRDIIKGMIDEFSDSEPELLIPKLGSGIEPLHSIWQRKINQKLESFLLSGDRNAVRDFIKTADIKYYEIQESESARIAFTNINYLKDIVSPHKF